MRPDCGIDLHLPHAARVALLQTSVTVGMDACFQNGSLCGPDQLSAAPAVTLGPPQQSCSFPGAGCSSFDAHTLSFGGSLKIGYHVTDGVAVHFCGTAVAAFRHGDFAGFPRVEVILSCATGNEAPPCGDFETFPCCLVRLRFWHRMLLTDQCVESVPLNGNSRFDLHAVAKLRDEVLHQGVRSIAVLVFPTTQDDFEFHLVPVSQEFHRPCPAHVHIVLADGERETDSLDFHLFLFCPTLPVLLFLLVGEFAKVHNTAHGRAGHWRDFHEIKTPFPSSAKRFLQGDDPDLLILLIDEPNFGNADLVIDPETSLYGRGGLVGETVAG